MVEELEAWRCWVSVEQGDSVASFLVAMLWWVRSVDVEVADCGGVQDYACCNTRRECRSSPAV